MRAPQSPTTLENPPPQRTLDDRRMPVQAKLAAAWTSFMFLFLYVDHLALYKPGVIDDILIGRVFEFDISPMLMSLILTIMSIPIFMILLSMTLPARANRAVNLVVASLNIPYAIFNVAGESSWLPFYVLAIGFELLVLGFILRTAWTWPAALAPDVR